MFADKYALVAELVDALDSKSSSSESVGSIPTQGTMWETSEKLSLFFYFNLIKFCIFSK